MSKPVAYKGNTQLTLVHELVAQADRYHVQVNPNLRRDMFALQDLIIRAMNDSINKETGYRATEKER